MKQLLKDLQKDIRKYTNIVADEMAKEVADELTDEAMYSIASFYMDYTPKSYKRHYYNFMDRSYRKFYSKNNGKNYIGGVLLTPWNLQDIYQDSKEEVFDTVYAGMHGPASGFSQDIAGDRVIPNVMKPSPMQRILDKQKDILDNIDKYQSKASAIAEKESYTVLSFN